MKRLILVAVGAWAVGGCGEGGEGLPFFDDLAPAKNVPVNSQVAKPDPAGTVSLPEVPLRAGLMSFEGTNGCSELEESIEERAITRLATLLERNRTYALKWAQQYHSTHSGTADAGSMSAGGGGGGSGGGSGAEASAGSGSGPSANGPASYTTTNTQVVGIDEADFVKNDGTRIFVISGRTLRAVRSWPPSALSSRGSLQVEGRPREMFLDGNRVLLFSTLMDSAQAGVPSWCVTNDDWCGDYYANLTVITLVDVTDLDNLVVTATWRVPGAYHAARRMGAKVFAVVNAPSYTEWAYDLPTYVSTWEHGQYLSVDEINRRYDELRDENARTLRARTLDDWLPLGSFSANGSVTAEPRSCANIHLPNGTTRFGATSVVSLDLSAPGPFSRSIVFARADEIYMSPSSLYFSNRHWWWWWSETNRDVTYLHKFDVSSGAPVYKASGVVNGFIVDQFSMDERNGFLRVAHTDRLQSASNWWGTTVNYVSVFAEQQNRSLGKIGQSDALAYGERVMSARFMGDTAYVVTFRQTDPLFTLDLSNPAWPKVVGELKVPGFSSYIHPLGPNHLLTIGTYQPENGNWQTRAVQLAIFDVSNLASPKQTHVQLVGTAYSSSEAQHDHRAFNYFPDKKMLAIPFFDWGYDSTSGYSVTSDLRLFGVDAEAGFSPKGTVKVDDLVVRDGCNGSYGCWSWWWQPAVRRSVMADDYVYAITSGGVRVAKMDALGTPVATAPFPYTP